MKNQNNYDYYFSAWFFVLNHELFELGISRNILSGGIELDWNIVDNLNGTTITGLSLQRDIEYRTFLRAVDLASNKSVVSETDGIYFDDSFPVVNRIDPDFYADTSQFLSVLSNDTIQLKFNRPIYSYDVQASSNVDSNFFAWKFPCSNATFSASFSTDTTFADDGDILRCSNSEGPI